MKLIRLESQNVKRLKLVRITPDGKGLVLVRGKNGQGKTSVLDSVRYLFGGKGTHPPRVIRDGEREAHVEAETEDFIALRRWRKGPDGEETTELELRGKDGGKLKSPQAILDSLYSATAFDPLEFMRLKPSAQLELLRKLLGVDTTALDTERERVFAERTNTNRDLGQAQARLKGVGIDTAPAPKLDVGALLARQSEVVAAQKRAAQAVAARDEAMRLVTSRRQLVVDAERALALARTRLAESEAAAATADNVVDDCEPPPPGELEAIASKLHEATTLAAAHERWAERQRLDAEVTKLEARTVEQSARLTEIDGAKAALVAGAKFPVPGLSFGAAGVLFDGRALEQASGAQQLRISVAVAVALNPKLRVMLVREGSLLDEDSLALLEQLCGEHDCQAWVEMVGTSGPASVVLADGEVVQ